VGFSRRGNYNLIETAVSKDQEAAAEAEWAACWEPTMRYTEVAHKQRAQTQHQVPPCEWRLELKLLRTGSSSPIRIALVA
jgi:hypothetical protein